MGMRTRAARRHARADVGATFICKTVESFPEVDPTFTEVLRVRADVCSERRAMEGPVREQKRKLHLAGKAENMAD